MHRINATIIVTEHDNGYSFQWDGEGDIIGVTKELIELGNDNLISKEDNLLHLGPYVVEIIDELENTYICQFKTIDFTLQKMTIDINK